MRKTIKSTETDPPILTPAEELEHEKQLEHGTEPYAPLDTGRTLEIVMGEYTRKTLKQLVPAPPRMMAVVLWKHDLSIERVPVLYVGIEERLTYRSTRGPCGVRPDRNQITDEYTVPVWLVRGIVDAEWALADVEEYGNHLLGYEDGGVEYDWTDLVKEIATLWQKEEEKEKRLKLEQTCASPQRAPDDPSHGAEPEDA